MPQVKSLALRRALYSALTAALLLPLSACTASTESLARAAVEAVTLPFKVYADSRSYHGPETIAIASAQVDDRSITLSCTLDRPLTGSFWGGHGYYEASFRYQFSSGHLRVRDRYSPTLKSATRNLEEARALCRFHKAAIVPRNGGFNIIVGSALVAFVGSNGDFVPVPPAPAAGA